MPKVGKRIVKLTPLEDSFALVTMLQINLQGRSIGAYLLRKGVDNFLIQFGFLVHSKKPVSVSRRRADSSFRSLWPS